MKEPKLGRGFFDFGGFLKIYACLDDEWSPQLYSWQQEGANVLFFTFINPDSMIVPNSFVNLGAKYLVFSPLVLNYVKKHTSLKIYKLSKTNRANLIYFSLVLREREEKKTKYFAP